MEFDRPWRRYVQPDGLTVYRPTLAAQMVGQSGKTLLAEFIVDSGADISLAPHRAAIQLGIEWSRGDPTTLVGISRKKACQVPGMIHPVEIVVREVNRVLSVPVCFAQGDAPVLLGREGMLDAFEVTFRKPALTTSFRLVAT